MTILGRAESVRRLDEARGLTGELAGAGGGGSREQGKGRGQEEEDTRAWMGSLADR